MPIEKYQKMFFHGVISILIKQFLTLAHNLEDNLNSMLVSFKLHKEKYDFIFFHT